MKQTILAGFSALLCMSAFCAPAYDTVIRNGLVVDGTGAPWFRGDVGISNGRVAYVGSLPAETSATRVIDAAGRYVTPGFIDVHTHSEGDLLTMPQAENFIRMGVTTLVMGNCGGSYQDLAQGFTSHTLKGTAPNVASLIGHNTIRGKVMGNEARDPSTTEMAEMKNLVTKAMQDGALGISTGLIYTPGLFSKTDEIVQLAKAVAPFHGIYATHMRSEGTSITEAINEALTVGREAGIPVEISHFKIVAPKRFGESTATIAQVENARAEGLDVTVDQYAYTASSTSLKTQLSDWAVEGTNEKVKARLADPVTREKIISEFIRDKKATGRPSMQYAQVASFRADPSLNGKNLLQITKELRKDDSWRAQAETILDMLTSGGASMVYHSIDEGDLRRIAAYPNTMFASDSGVRQFGSGVPHPRGYGNNARVLAKFVTTDRILRFEDAVRKMTSLPARTMKLFDRGVLRPGAAADILIFDLAKVKDPSTFEKPHAYAEGFDYVLVNGTPVIDNGKITDALPGKVLYGPGKQTN